MSRAGVPTDPHPIRLDAAPERRRRRALVTAALVLVAGFSVLAIAVVGDGAVTRFDGGVNLFFEPYRTQPWLSVFLWLTTLGTGAALVAVMTTASGMLWA